MNEVKKGRIYVVLAALLWGLAPVFMAKSYTYGNTPMSMAFFRNLFAIPLLWIVSFKKKESYRFNKTDIVQLFLAAFFGIVLTTLFLFTSYLSIGVGTATTLHFTYPLVVMVVCALIYHDKIDKKQWMAVLLAMVGIACFFEKQGSVIGLIEALVSGVMFAIYLIMVEKKNFERFPTFLLSLMLAVLSSLQFFVYDLFTHEIVYMQNMQSYGLMLLVSLMTSVFGVIFLNEGIKRIGSKEASITCLLEPVSGMIFGMLFLQEELGLMKLVGAVLIVLGIFLSVEKEEK